MKEALPGGSGLGERAQHEPRWVLLVPRASQASDSPSTLRGGAEGGALSLPLRAGDGPSLGTVFPQPHDQPKRGALTVPSAGPRGAHLPGGRRGEALSCTKASLPAWYPTRAGLLGTDSRRCRGRGAPKLWESDDTIYLSLLLHDGKLRSGEGPSHAANEWQSPGRCREAGLPSPCQTTPARGLGVQSQRPVPDPRPLSRCPSRRAPPLTWHSRSSA